MISLTKFINGTAAREKWSKNIGVLNPLSILEFNQICNNSFIKRADIVLDDNIKRQSTITVQNFNKDIWSQKKEHIYIFTKNDVIMKIGGTRDGLKGRWGSYGCGYYVPERNNKQGVPYPGKMSVTNAYLYHTIEKDLLENQSKWEIYSWLLPDMKFPVSILDREVNIFAQTFHAYESVCINKYKEKTGYIPILCDNSDPNY